MVVRGKNQGALGAILLLGLLTAPAPALAAGTGKIRAGAMSLGATWHVGASAGQYASDGTPVSVHEQGPAGDPGFHSTRRASSYGVQSRLSVRVIVVEGPDGARHAIVKNDFYIPQDLIWRRAAHLLEAKPELGIDRENLTMAVTHNHSSPFYSSTSWGVWTFQDVFDVRFYEYYAHFMARAVQTAVERLKPARVGASVSYFDKTHRHSFGGTLADDGTPAGYPKADIDTDLTVLRFDDVSNPRRPRPIATLVNWGGHPEFLSGNDLISADYVGATERMTDRLTRGVTVWTQGDVGTAEPERSETHSIHERLEFSHKEYSQTEWAGHLLSRKIYDTWLDIERRTPEMPDRFVPFTTTGKVASVDKWFPGPISHPYPGVSSCRTDPGINGDPRIPVVGLPDCVSTFEGPHALADFAGFPEPPTPATNPIDPGLSTDDFQRAGIPVPENYSAPSYGALEEDQSVHLQALRIGDILLTFCSCEQWKDQSLNIKTRTNRVKGDIWRGYDWTKECTQQPDKKWICPDPRTRSFYADPKNLDPIGDEYIQRIKAQVNNDAAGWNTYEYLPYAESEPVDPAKIKGNYTHTELPPAQGYKLTVAVSMANDYNGYIATYREYQRGDHYRKALTGWGPHSSDYMATHLVEMGGFLNGGPPVPDDPGQEDVEADVALNDQKARAIGTSGEQAIRDYEATLPDDGGKPGEVIEQPKDLERFGAAFLKFVGGSNYTDSPKVRIHRRLPSGRWKQFADQTGEIQLTIDWPEGDQVQSYANGTHKWIWTAHFEAFASPFYVGMPGGFTATPPGIYRFYVRGWHRTGGKQRFYDFYSREFRVRPWSGIAVDDLRVSKAGRVSFALGPRKVVELKGNPDAKPVALQDLKAEIGPIDYPDSYKSPARFIQEERTVQRDPKAPNDVSKLEWYCLRCSFRPWIDSGDARRVTFVVTAGHGRRVRGVRRGGRWVMRGRLCRGETAFVPRRGVRDRFGNFNGKASATVAGKRRC
jgi:hypothetical protein